MRLKFPPALRAVTSLILLAVVQGAAAKPAELATYDAGQLFVEVVQPTLKQQCLGCHGEGNTFGKLDLRTRERMLRGGANGPAIYPGKASQSLLIKAIEQTGPLKMPPGEDKKLDAATITAFRYWIDGGAPFAEPRAQKQTWDYDEKDIWAFRPVKEVNPPLQRVDLDQVSTPVDAFVLAKLAENGLAPAPRAGRITLIRRATFDLTGLPPTPEEVEAFVSDHSPRAYEKLIERLLASPRYGERWGRHWLDVTRYADTNGFSNDYERPNAWRYRDYVIRSFNQDKPYNRFIREQIAGDELYPDDPEALIATGFLRAGPWEHTGMQVAAVSRQMFLDDVTHHTGTVFLGLTLGCARCHDHKFDPLPTEDYYRLQAVFATTQFARRRLPLLPEENGSGFDDGLARMDRWLRQLSERTASYTEISKQAVLDEYRVGRVEDLPPGVLEEAVNKKKGLTPEQFEAFKMYRKHMQLIGEMRDRYRPMAWSVSSGYLDEKLGKVDTGPSDRKATLALEEDPGVFVLVGGNLQSPGKKVTPGVLSAVERYSGFPAPEIPQTITGRRAALANWIADPDNPLAARVMANRIWQYHFGRGIVEDANNFGKMGGKPTHPGLLDWLAAYFVDHGWSLKQMHRVIMLSQAYQRSSTHPARDTIGEKDPDNELLAYFSPRRLEAEELRDSMLFVAGELSMETGGPGAFPEINRDVARQPQHRMGTVAPPYRPSPKKAQRNRRTIYTYKARTLTDPLIEPFDPAGMDISCARRNQTTVPTQAFTLMNSRFSYDAALAFADRLQKESSDSRARVERAFQLAWNHEPSEEEIQWSLEHLAEMTAHHRAHTPEPRKPPEPFVHEITSELTGETFEIEAFTEAVDYEHNLHPSEVSPETRAWADLALVLLNSNQFVYVY